jgi:hypothetical protein
MMMKKNKKKFKIIWIVIKKYYLYTNKTNISKMNTLTIKTKKLQFGNNNEVKGWFKLTNGERTDFQITNDGEIKQTGSNNKKIHPFVIGLYEMLFSND